MDSPLRARGQAHNQLDFAVWHAQSRGDRFSGLTFSGQDANAMTAFSNVQFSGSQPIGVGDEYFTVSSSA